MEILFTARELDVMNTLWDQGPATVAEVRKALDDHLAYTTAEIACPNDQHTPVGRWEAHHPPYKARQNAPAKKQNDIQNDKADKQPAREFTEKEIEYSGADQGCKQRSQTYCLQFIYQPVRALRIVN